MQPQVLPEGGVVDFSDPMGCGWGSTLYGRVLVVDVCHESVNCAEVRAVLSTKLPTSSHYGVAARKTCDIAKLLHAATCFYMLLHVTTCCYMLPHAATFFLHVVWAVFRLEQSILHQQVREHTAVMVNLVAIRQLCQSHYFPQSDAIRPLKTR